MKFKTLKKKIRRLETRLLEGPKKLAKLKGKLAALATANAAKAKKKSMARAAAAGKRKRSSTAESQVKPVATKRTGTPKKKKRKLNLSPERREQLAAAMRARWAAKRAVDSAPSNTSGNRDFTIGQVPQSP
jgi:predicted  nucleic acid-binding Zn-ribbon protein